MRAIRNLLVLLWVACLPASLHAQSIPLPEDEFQQTMERHPGNWLVMSGDRIIHDSLAGGDDLNLGRLSTLPLVITTFRMLEDEVIGIDDRVDRWAPELGLDIPFTVPITVRHLLAETAGFKVPDWLSQDGWAKLQGSDLSGHESLEPYNKLLRTAGMMTHKDAIGSMALIRVLESAGGEDILSLYQRYVLRPAGISNAALWLDSADNVPSFLAPAISLHASPGALTAMLAVLGTNRRQDGEPFLTQRARISMERDIAWQIHPMGPGRTLGFSRRWVQDRLTLGIDPWPCLAGSDVSAMGLVWFPAADLVIIHDGCSGDMDSLLADLAVAFLPPVDRADDLAASVDVRMPKFPGGYYLPDDAPTDWLSLKLDRIWEQSILYNPTRDGAEIWRLGEPLARYRAFAPLAYRNAAGEELIVRPEFQGGHLYWQGRYYRYAGPFGDPVMALSPFFWMLGVILTGGVYAVFTNDKVWRRMGKFCLAGPLLLAAGLAAEINLWPSVWIAEEGFWRVIGWRLVLNAGVIAIISVIFFSLSFTRNGNMPAHGPRYIGASIHLLAMTAAACVLILLTLAWGIAGSLSPS